MHLVPSKHCLSTRQRQRKATGLIWQAVSLAIILAVPHSLSAQTSSENKRLLPQSPQSWILIDKDGKTIQHPESYFTVAEGGYAFSNSDRSPYVDILLDHAVEGEFRFYGNLKLSLLDKQNTKTNPSVEFGFVETENRRQTFLVPSYQEMGTNYNFDAKQSATELRFKTDHETIFDRQSNSSPVKFFYRIPVGCRVQLRDRAMVIQPKQSASKETAQKLLEEGELSENETLLTLPFAIRQFETNITDEFIVAQDESNNQIAIIDSGKKQTVKVIKNPPGSTRFATNHEHLFVWSMATNAIQKIALNSGKIEASKKLKSNLYFVDIAAGSKYLLGIGHPFGKQRTFHLFDSTSLEELPLTVPNISPPLFQLPVLQGTTGSTGLQHFVFNSRNSWNGFSIVEPSEVTGTRSLVEFRTRGSRNLMNEIRNKRFVFKATFPQAIEKDTPSEIELDMYYVDAWGTPISKIENTRIMATKPYGTSDRGYEAVLRRANFLEEQNLLVFLTGSQTCRQFIFRDFDWEKKIVLNQEKVKFFQPRYSKTVFAGQRVVVPFELLAQGDTVELKFGNSKTTLAKEASLENGVFIWNVPADFRPRKILTRILATYKASRVSNGRKIFRAYSDDINLEFNVVNDVSQIANGLDRFNFDVGQFHSLKNKDIANHIAVRLFPAPPKQPTISATSKPNGETGTTMTVNVTKIESRRKRRNYPFGFTGRQQIQVGRGGEQIFLLDSENQRIKTFDIATDKFVDEIPMPGDVLFTVGRSQIIFYDNKLKTIQIVNLKTKQLQNVKLDLAETVDAIKMGYDDDRFLYVLGKQERRRVIQVVDLTKVGEGAGSIFELGTVDQNTWHNIDVSADGNHFQFHPGSGFSFENGSFRRWALQSVRYGTTGLSFSRSGRYLLGERGIFESSAIKTSTQLRVPDLSSDLFAVLEDYKLAIFKVGTSSPIQIFNEPTGPKNNTKDAFKGRGSNLKLVLNIKLGKLVAFNYRGEIETYSFNVDALDQDSKVSVSSLDFLASTKTIESGKPWEFSLNSPAGQIKPNVELVIGEPQLHLENGKLICDNPNFDTHAVPVLLDFKTKMLPQVGLFLKTDKYDPQRNAILRHAHSARPNYVEKTQSVGSHTFSNTPTTMFQFGSSGESLLIKQSGRYALLPVERLKYRSFKKILTNFRPTQVAMGLNYLGVANPDEFFSLDPVSDQKILADSAVVPEHMAMGRTSNTIFVIHDYKLESFDAGTMKKSGSLPIGDTSKVTGLKVSGCGNLVCVVRSSGSGFSELRKQNDTDSWPSKIKVVEFGPKTQSYALNDAPRISQDGQILTSGNNIYDRNLQLIESFDEGVYAMPTDTQNVVAKIENMDQNVITVSLIHLETGLSFSKATIEKDSIKPLQKDDTLEFLDFQVSRKRLIYTTKRRQVIRSLELSFDQIGEFPTIVSFPLTEVRSNEPFRYRPRIVANQYPLHLRLVRAPAEARVNETGEIEWDNPTSDPQPFRVSIRDIRGRESIQEFSVQSN